MKRTTITQSPESHMRGNIHAGHTVWGVYWVIVRVIVRVIVEPQNPTRQEKGGASSGGSQNNTFRSRFFFLTALPTCPDRKLRPRPMEAEQRTTHELSAWTTICRSISFSPWLYGSFSLLRRSKLTGRTAPYRRGTFQW